MGKRTRCWKRMLVVALSLMLVFSLTGCAGYDVNTTLHSDGTSALTLKFLYEKNFYDSMLKDANADGANAMESGDFTKTTQIIGKYTYYVFGRDFSFASYDELKNFLCDLSSFKAAMQKDSKKPEAYDTLDSPLFAEAVVSADYFKAKLNSDNVENGFAKGGTDGNSDDLSNVKNFNEYYQNEAGIRLDFALTFPNAPTASNGTISGNTVTWDLAGMSSSGTLIAEVGGTQIASDRSAPVISGVKDKAIYKKEKVAMAEDDVCLQSFTINGQDRGIDKVIVGAEKDGKYKLVATDAAGNVTTKTVTIDKKKPTIKGAKNKKNYKKKVKLKFNDKYGIKKITVNGKKIKTTKSKTFKKSGKYKVKVTDRAGNTSCITFRIQKKK